MELSTRTILDILDSEDISPEAKDEVLDKWKVPEEEAKKAEARMKAWLSIPANQEKMAKSIKENNSLLEGMKK